MKNKKHPITLLFYNIMSGVPKGHERKRAQTCHII